MKLELLPNEILLDLFDYFHGMDLLQAFYGLNSRFNLLLYNQFRSYRFRFSLISKRDFDMICQQHLPFIANQVIAIYLSNYKETPEQINLFLSYMPSFRPFTHLRSLIIYNLYSYQTLLKLLDECQHLSSLTHLNLYSCSFSSPKTDCQLIINNIWNLPKLTHCQVRININEQQVFCVPTIVSTSLEFVTIYNKLKLNQMHRLFDYTPHLNSLSTFTDDFNNDYIPSPLPTLMKLAICFFSSFDISKMPVFFQSMSNLRHLTIHTSSELINGHQWERIIRNYLPKLKTFRLSMQAGPVFEGDIQEQADELINSFQSSFWIIEHQWFVRCITQNQTIYLYTLSDVPYYRDTFSDSCKSTYPHDNQQEFYNDVHSIYDEAFFDRELSPSICLPNIKSLHIKLLINDQFWSIVPNLKKLTTLLISCYTETFQTQLQTLLDQAPHLVTLTIRQNASLPLQMSLFKYTNASIHRLDLRSCNHYFNDEECLIIAQSSLGAKCQVLSIRVINRESIINLVKNIIGLRLFIVRCADDKYHTQSISTNGNDEMIQWLKDRLSSTYMIVRDAEVEQNIIIWM